MHHKIEYSEESLKDELKAADLELDSANDFDISRRHHYHHNHHCHHHVHRGRAWRRGWSSCSCRPEVACSSTLHTSPALQYKLREVPGLWSVQQMQQLQHEGDRPVNCALCSGTGLETADQNAELMMTTVDTNILILLYVCILYMQSSHFYPIFMCGKDHSHSQHHFNALGCAWCSHWCSWVGGIYWEGRGYALHNECCSVIWWLQQPGLQLAQMTQIWSDLVTALTGKCSILSPAPRSLPTAGNAMQSSNYEWVHAISSRLNYSYLLLTAILNEGTGRDSFFQMMQKHSWVISTELQYCYSLQGDLQRWGFASGSAAGSRPRTAPSQRSLCGSHLTSYRNIDGN